MKPTTPGFHPSAGQLRELYRVVAPLHFVASRHELVTAGFTVPRIRNWNRNGRLIRVVRSVYSYGRDVETREAAMRVGLAAAGPGSALTGASACETWGIIDQRTRLPRQIKVATTSGRARTLTGLSPALQNTNVHIVKRSIEAHEIRVKDGLEVVNPTLALIEFSADAADQRVRFAFLEACRLGHFSEVDLAYCYTRLMGRPGTGKLRPYLGLWVPELARTKSILEGWVVIEWVPTGWPMPLVNETIFGYEVDFYWPDQRHVLETDGHAFHSDPVQTKLDIEKQRHLEAQGLTVNRMTYRQFAANPAAAIAAQGALLGFR